MNLNETPEDSGDAEETKKRQHWPIEVKRGSVTAKIYRIPRKGKNGKPGRFVFNVCYYLPEGRKVEQRGTLEKAREHARLMVETLADGEGDVADMSKNDRLELLALRDRAGKLGVQPLMALDEWLKARELVGVELMAACQAWNRRATKFTRISVHAAVEKFKERLLARRRTKILGRGGSEKDVKLSKSHRTVLAQFQEEFGDRYLDEFQKSEFEAWFAKKGSKSGWTGNTYRKRIVTLFRWARKNGFLPGDLITEPERTEMMEAEAPKRIVIEPWLLKRLLVLLQFGRDLDATDKKFDPRPEFVPALALATFCGMRSSEVDGQSWEDIDFEDCQLNVTIAKEGTPADRAIDCERRREHHQERAV